MKLLGKDIPAAALLETVQRRIAGRSVIDGRIEHLEVEDPEAFADPMQFHLHAMVRHANPLEPLPSGSGQPLLQAAANVGKRILRTALAPVLRELMARQGLFNAHSRDATAQLAAEVQALKREVEQLRAKRKGSNRS